MTGVRGKSLGWCVAPVVLLGLLGCGPEGIVDRREAQVRFGLLADFTGSAPGSLESVELALEQANQALAAWRRDHSADEEQRALADYEFDLAPVPTGGFDIEPGLEARLLVEQQDARAIITGRDAETLEAAGALNYNADFQLNRETVVTCAACVSPRLNSCLETDEDPVTQDTLRDLDRLIFRTSPSYAQIAMVAVREVLLTRSGGGDAGDTNGDGYFKIAAYDAEGIDSHRLREAYEAALRELAVPQWGETRVIFELQTFDPGEDPEEFEAEELMDALLDSESSDTQQDVFPDAIVGDAPPAFEARLNIAYIASQSSVFYLRGPGFREELVQTVLGASVDGAVGVSQQVVTDTSAGAAFRDLKINQRGRVPAIYDANYYDAAVAIVLGAWIGLRALGGEAETLSSSQIQFGLRRLSGDEGLTIGPTDLYAAFQRIQAATPDEARFDDLINYRGASGPVDFRGPATLIPGRCLDDDPQSGGDAPVQLVRYRVENGRVVEDQVFECANDPACPSAS